MHHPHAESRTEDGAYFSTYVFRPEFLFVYIVAGVDPVQKFFKDGVWLQPKMIPFCPKIMGGGGVTNPKMTIFV